MHPENTSPIDNKPAGERLAKRIARAGTCSRREAEKLIESGRVEVDGKTIISPATNVTPEQRICIDGTMLATAEHTRLWLYHKPAGLLTSHSDKDGHATVFAHLPKELPRVISVGRLDLNTEGLLLLTNDGVLTRYLEHPSTGWKRRYRVRFYGTLSRHALDALQSGITIDDIVYAPAHVELEKTTEAKANKWAIVTLTEGKNREIRKLFTHFGCEISRLIRVSYGPFQLGKLPAGAIKEIPEKALHEALGKWQS